MTESNRAEILRIEGVSMTFGGTRALDDVSFSVKEGSVHALLGGNGSGKSTLIKILAGVQGADSGSYSVGTTRIDARHVTPDDAAHAGLRFVHQAVGTFDDFSVAENFALGSSYGAKAVGSINWKDLNKRVKETLDRFEMDVPPEALISSLRPAQKTLVAIARALEDEDDSKVLFLDEPTATLPAHEVELVHETIRRYVGSSRAVVIVTHRVDEVLTMATDVTFLRDGHHVLTRSADGVDERILMQEIAGMDTPPDAAADRDRTIGDVALRVENLAVGALGDVSFELKAGEILGISGLEGSGRSSLLRAIGGMRQQRTGTITFEGVELPSDQRADRAIAMGIVYVPEDRAADGVFADRSIRENLTAPAIHTFTRGGRVSSRLERAAAETDIGRYGIVCSSQEAPISSLSGGNQQKVVLARWLEMKPKLLLLDEPTQGVDVGARLAVHEAIRKSAEEGMAILVASSDTRELSELSDRVLGLSNGRVSGELTQGEVTPQRCVELAYALDDAHQSTPDLTTTIGEE